ncbi:hypothetical protein D3C76_1533550 [compost metagenome]
MLHMLSNQTAQVFFVDRQCVNVQHFDQFRVNAFAELTVFVQDVGEAARHTCAEVHAGFAHYADNPAGHVFTTVIADAFYDGNSTGVTHRKALASPACSKQTPAGSTVQTGVADDAGFMAAEC